ncbi:MAG TPA: hypothetical protein VK807_18030 [Gemmatimonadaceae bacterium]|nr:hypothetical protein [Gemmatimonadaceae bacterium]
MRAYFKLITLAAAGLAVTACNESLVPDYNNLTAFPHSAASLQNEFSGAFSRDRTDVGGFIQAMEGFARNAAYFTPSEERFVTELTGQTPLDDDNFGALAWDIEYNAAKVADSVQAILPSLTVNGAPIPAASLKALQGVIETTKAMDYMLIEVAHDTNGTAIGAPGQPYTGTLAPILCATDSWKAIVAMLDSAVADLNAAGASTTLSIPGTNFSLTLPPTYAALGNTAGGFEGLTLALRGRARVELAYAIARKSAATAPSVSTPGSPDQNQLDSAITDIQASSLYSPTLSASEAVAANDLGVSFAFSSASGDITNPIFGNAGGTFALELAVSQIDSLHDQRFLAVFSPAGSQPTSEGASTASSYSMNLSNIGTNTPITITRNVQLQFLLARAYLGTGQTAKAATIVDNVRTAVGGLASGLGSVNTGDYVSVRDFLMRELRPSLIMDGTGDMVAAIRDYGLIMADLTTWGAKDQHTTMENIPAVERQQRNNNFAAVCP